MESINISSKNRRPCKLTDRYARQIARLQTSVQAKCPRLAANTIA